MGVSCNEVKNIWADSTISDYGLFSIGTMIASECGAAFLQDDSKTPRSVFLQQKRPYARV
jgi:hypothetical protein